MRWRADREERPAPMVMLQSPATGVTRAVVSRARTVASQRDSQHF